MSTLRILALSVAASAAIAISGCSSDSSTDSRLHVRNNSDFNITEIHVTSVGSSDWGPNLLDSDLAPGDTLLVDVSCGTYDAMLIDEQGVDCQVHDKELCFDRADWVIDNNVCTFGSTVVPREDPKLSNTSGSATPTAQ